MYGNLEDPLSMQLTIPLSKNDGSLFRQVYLGLRQAILSGRFRADGRLPSTRDLADQLGVSRTVVLLAYDQLLAEGFVTGRRGSGTYVAESLSSDRLVTSKKSTRLRLSTFGSVAADAAATLDFSGRRLRLHRYDFAFGRSESDIETLIERRFHDNRQPQRRRREPMPRFHGRIVSPVASLSQTGLMRWSAAK